MSRGVPAEARRFLVVGAFAYLVDVSAFWLLTEYLHYSSNTARLTAFVVTILVTYVLNGRYTFRVTLQRASLSRYVLVQLVGAVINLGVFWLVLSSNLGILPVICLTLGSLCGSTFNFITMRIWVFNDTLPASG
ncbi:MAG: putative flippase GtrA [Limisphaerales bacterium]